MAKPSQKETRTKVSQTEFPNITLENAARIAKALWDNFAGKGAAPHNIALALNLSPTSGGWRNLCGSSIAYGLSEGGYNAQQIVLTEIGRRIVAPTTEGDDHAALRQALLRPRVEREFFQKYDRAKFPRDDIACNVLVELGLPKDRAANALEIIKANGQFVRAIVETKTGPFVTLEGTQFQGGTAAEQVSEGEALDQVADATNDEVIFEGDTGSAAASSAAVAKPAGPRFLFLAHGKNHKPLEEMKKILEQFGIPYKVAVDEAHAGRPISKKVADLMKNCSAGIFIFTRDEKFFDENGQEVWRPSENVVYELGAASVLWEKKNIIVKEDGVFFPSDFSDLGHISFDQTGVSGRALDIMRELVGLGLVKVHAAE